MISAFVGSLEVDVSDKWIFLSIMKLITITTLIISSLFASPIAHYVSSLDSDGSNSPSLIEFQENEHSKSSAVEIKVSVVVLKTDVQGESASLTADQASTSCCDCVFSKFNVKRQDCCPCPEANRQELVELLFVDDTESSDEESPEEGFTEEDINDTPVQLTEESDFGAFVDVELTNERTSDTLSNLESIETANRTIDANPTNDVEFK